MRRRLRLAQLLKYRKSIEDQRQTALALIKEKRYREEEKLFHTREAQRAYQRELQDTQSEASFHLSYLNSLSQDTFSQKRMIQDLQGQILKATDDLVEASKSRKTIEKLRDREIERHKQYLLKQERKYLDELAADRFIRLNSKSDK